MQSSEENRKLLIIQDEDYYSPQLHATWKEIVQLKRDSSLYPTNAIELHDRAKRLEDCYLSYLYTKEAALSSLSSFSQLPVERSVTGSIKYSMVMKGPFIGYMVLRRKEKKVYAIKFFWDRSIQI